MSTNKERDGWKNLFSSVKPDGYHGSRNLVNELMKLPCVTHPLEIYENCPIEYLVKHFKKLLQELETTFRMDHGDIAEKIAFAIKPCGDDKPLSSDACSSSAGEDVEVESIAKKIRSVCYPSLGNKSVTQIATKDLPSRLAVTVPVYSHPICVDIYNEYLSIKKQVKEKKTKLSAFGYDFEIEEVQRCSNDIQCALDTYQKREESFNLSGRGVMASGLLRASELTYTARLVNILGPLAFPDPNVGCILHQMPTRKREVATGNPELADGYCCGLIYGELHAPMVSWDTKLSDMAHARRTSICHSVNLVQVNHNYNKWPVLLSLPNTVEGRMSLEVHIPVSNSMWVCPVLSKSPTDVEFLCLIAASIRKVCLEQREFETESPLDHMLPMKNAKPLGLSYNVTDCRTYLLPDNCVYKYYEKKDLVVSPNVETVKKYGSLSNVSLINVTNDGSIVALKYDYIEGTHEITNVKQLIGVLKTLMMLHRNKLVHGDVRACNVIFTSSSSHLIDYDLVGKAHTARYKVQYQFFEAERHQDARAGILMEKEHDRYALSLVLERQLPDATEVIAKLRDIQIDLGSIIKYIEHL